MLAYQESGHYFVQVPRGVEDLASQELEWLGVRPLQRVPGGLHVESDRAGLYRMNYGSRLAVHVFAPLISFTCRREGDLYDAARSLDWPSLMRLDQTFAVSANVSGHPELRHSRYAALRVKDALADAFRDATGVRPSVRTENPDVAFHLHLRRQDAVLYQDTSGGSLHRRGYRRVSVAAPMQETLAAAILALSGWNGERPLYDPMCGSGTLLCEALLRAARIPPGYLRARFGFEQLPDYEPTLWQRIRQDLDGHIQAPPAGLLAGGDLDPEAVAAARANLDALPHGARVAVRVQDVADWEGLDRGVVVCNPPYGIRLGKRHEAMQTWKALGSALKRRAAGSEAYLYAGEPELVRSTGLRPDWTRLLYNGGLEGVLARFQLYEGSRVEE